MHKIHLKSKLEQKHIQIAQQKRNLEFAKSQLPIGNVQVDAIEQLIASLKRDLASLSSSRTFHTAAAESISEESSFLQEQLAKTDREISAISSRIQGTLIVQEEIGAEIETLSLNEEAKRLLESIPEICAVPNCGLFGRAKEAYGKNLLYLRDQLKDIESSISRARIRLEVLHEQRKNLLRRLSEHSAFKVSPEDSADTDRVNAAGALWKKILDLERDKVSLQSYNEISIQFANLNLERDAIHEQLAALSGSEGKEVEFSRLRTELRSLMVKWLDVLDTQNVHKNISIESDLTIRFGSEQLSAIKGSTKTRAVLAFHAALFEHYLNTVETGFRFLVLDTPKQHEIHDEDLTNFVRELRQLAEKRHAQVVMSTSSLRFDNNLIDVAWHPPYQGKEQYMYLGEAKYLSADISA